MCGIRREILLISNLDDNDDLKEFECEPDEDFEL